MSFKINVSPFISNIRHNGINNMVNPFITYYDNKGIQSSIFPFITTKMNDDIDVVKKKVFYVYNSFTKQQIKCNMYENTNGFPLKDAYLTVYDEQNDKKYYVPLNLVGHDFDSSLRCSDIYGNVYQICTGRQSNIVKKYLNNGNYLINCSNNYNYIYKSLVGILGYARVKMYDDYVTFIAPEKSSHITRLFVMGLNIVISSNNNDTNFGTLYNGLNHTSYGGDEHWKGNCMLLKLTPGNTYSIKSFDYGRTMSYKDSDIVKNAIVIGSIVESFPSMSSSYQQLIDSDNWYIYNSDKNLIVKGQNNVYVLYFKNHYLKYQNSRREYNYYEI